jgi:hypothetical protein
MGGSFQFSVFSFQGGGEEKGEAFSSQGSGADEGGAAGEDYEWQNGIGDDRLPNAEN